VKKYTIELWCNRDRCWKLMAGVPQRFLTRKHAEERLRFEADTTPRRRCRLVNGKGITVLHAGVVEGGAA
jgi:hypothetical protein